MIEEQDKNQFVVAATAKLAVIDTHFTNMVAMKIFIKTALMLYLKI